MTQRLTKVYPVSWTLENDSVILVFRLAERLRLYSAVGDAPEALKA